MSGATIVNVVVFTTIAVHIFGTDSIFRNFTFSNVLEETPVDATEF